MNSEEFRLYMLKLEEINKGIKSLNESSLSGCGIALFFILSFISLWCFYVFGGFQEIRKRADQMDNIERQLIEINQREKKEN